MPLLLRRRAPRHAAAILAVTLTTFAATAAHASSVQLSHNTWEQFVFPALTRTQTIGDLLGDDLPGEDYGRTWILYEYDPRAGGYRNPGLSGTVESGNAFWIIQTTGETVTLDIPEDVAEYLGDTSDACRSEYGCLEKPLPTDGDGTTWHMLGSPYPEPLDMAYVTLKTDRGAGGCSTARGCSIEDTGLAGITSSHGYFYSSASGEYEQAKPDTVLRPWQGFWFATRDGGSHDGLRMYLPDPKLCL